MNFIVRASLVIFYVVIIGGANIGIFGILGDKDLISIICDICIVFLCVGMGGLLLPCAIRDWKQDWDKKR